MRVLEKPLTVGDEDLSELSKELGFVVLREKTGWRVYHHPAQVLLAYDPQSLVDTLAAVNKHVAAGGEAAGFLCYEAGYALEPRLHHLLSGSTNPLCWFGLYDRSFTLNTSSIPYDDIEEIVQESISTITSTQYGTALDSIHDLIVAGDVYQINFTYRLAFKLKCTVWQMFAALCHRHPVPYAAFVNCGFEQIAAHSPELFFDIRGNNIVVKPMKGTADRGLTLASDVESAQALQASEKNRAENVMIVDLMRNDLGRICQPGSVKTTTLFDVERFSSVWQMTSTIEGKLRDDAAPDSILRSLFPSGSVTGVPKIRAMEVISDLETSERDVYTGAIGYFAPSQSQFNVAIRTVVVREGMGSLGIGSGITHDSSSSAEWKECDSKAAFLTHSRPSFKIIETLRWNGEYWLLEEHLSRMRDSAEYFGFPFDEATIRRALQRIVPQFEAQPLRVRLLLAQNGSSELDHSQLDSALFGQVRLAERRVLSTDRFFYHKTTNRKMYNEELAIAKSVQCDDSLFFNERGELTEGAIHNVFLLAGGVWRTPALSCGVLAGTYRAYFLRNHPGTREEVLTLSDLTCSDAIYLCNSVRGIFPVRLSQGLDIAGEMEGFNR